MQERPLFTLAMLEDVLTALKSSKVNSCIIVSSDTTVEELVKSFGMTFINENQKGLNQALNQATRWCILNNAERVLILPADVPLITSTDVNNIVKMAQNNTMVISPSQNGGTNALLQTPPGIVSPSFGPDSFRKHIKKALTKRVQTKIYVSSNIMLDIDSERDLDQLLKGGQTTIANQFLRQSTWVKSYPPMK